MFWSYRALDCIIMFFFFFFFLWLMMYFVLFELSMIRGDTVMFLFLFLISHCATLIIDLYL